MTLEIRVEMVLAIYRKQVFGLELIDEKPHLNLHKLSLKGTNINRILWDFAGQDYGKLVFCKRIYDPPTAVPTSDTELHLLFWQAVHHNVEVRPAICQIEIISL